MRILFLMSVSFIWTLPSPIQAQSVKKSSSLNRYIDALISARKLVTYSDDGAADASVTAVGENDTGIVVDPLPEVRDVVNLKARAIPLLIAHLDDGRLTAALLDPNHPKRVPVGYVCLDLLINLTRAPKIHIADCADDGLGACVNDRYYFRPDAFTREGERYVALPIVRRVKDKWWQSYRQGEVRFQYPSWWKAPA